MLLVLLLSAVGMTNVFAQSEYYDFSATVSGNTLYFKITDNENHYVKTVPPVSFHWGELPKPTGTIALPQTITHDAITYTLTEVGDYSFYYCSGLTGVTFPSSVTGIGEYAFYSSGLTTVDVNVSYIGHYAFSYSQLKTLTIGSGVTSMGAQVFNGNPLESVTYNATNCTVYNTSNPPFYGCSHDCTLSIDNVVTSIPDHMFSGFTGLKTIGNWGGVITIGDYAFRGCGFTTLIIPDAITTLGESAFYGCASLGSVTFGSGLKSMGRYLFTDCTSLSSVVFHANMTTTGNNTFSGCTSLNGSGITWGGVTSIGDYAFYYCTGMTSIDLNSITSIGEYAFYYSGLTTLELNASYIGPYAFYYSKLKTLTIGPNVTDMRALAFCGNPLESVTYNATSCSAYRPFDGCTHDCTLSIGSAVTSISDDAFNGFAGLKTISSWGGVNGIGNNAFYGCGLTALAIPDAITTLGSSVFSGCTSLESVTFGNGLTTTGNSTFSSCTSLENVTLTDNITTIGSYSFSGCTSLTSFTFPSGVTTIESGAFYNTSLTTININLAYIGQDVFSYNSNLTTLILGPNVSSIDHQAFLGCTSLNNVTIMRTESVIDALGSGVFDAAGDNLAVMYVPASLLIGYKTADHWSGYASKMQGWMEKTVAGYGDSTESDGWAFIAFPLTSNTLPTAYDGMIASTATEYDLYRFNPTAALEWENYKAHTGDFEFVNGKGYLYANKNDVTFMIKGEMFTGSSKDVTVGNGWELVGNPYGQAAYVNRSYYKMNAAGDDIEAVSSYTTNTIPAATGIVVRGNATDDYVTFTTTAPAKASGHGSLEMTLAKVDNNGEEVHDKAFVSFEEGNTLPKYIFNENHAKLYIPNNGKDYAIANPERANEMPLNFKATQNGEYTLTVKPENVEMDYLHLIDNLTGANIDLLATPSYQFTGRKSDYASRFKLVFQYNGVEEEQEAAESFAFISNGNIIVTGEGTLQAFDALGRCVLSQEVTTLNSQLSTLNFQAPGVYVLRLTQGNIVRNQKIIIK